MYVKLQLFLFIFYWLKTEEYLTSDPFRQEATDTAQHCGCPRMEIPVIKCACACVCMCTCVCFQYSADSDSLVVCWLAPRRFSHVCILHADVCDSDVCVCVLHTDLCMYVRRVSPHALC